MSSCLSSLFLWAMDCFECDNNIITWSSDISAVFVKHVNDWEDTQAPVCYPSHREVIAFFTWAPKFERNLKLTCNWLISHLGNIVGIPFRSIDSHSRWLLISFSFSNDSICSDRCTPIWTHSIISHSWVEQNLSAQWIFETDSMF